MFFGPDVLSEPDETESALRKEFDLMDLPAINVIFLRGCGVILLRLGDILDLLFDFAEHVLEVREHRLFVWIFNYSNSKFYYLFV